VLHKKQGLYLLSQICLGVKLSILFLLIGNTKYRLQKNSPGPAKNVRYNRCSKFSKKIVCKDSSGHNLIKLLGAYLGA